VTRPRVSIVIPSYNQAEFLGDALASARGQRDVSAEIIVVDDGSTDDTGRVADACGARVVRQPNLGVSAARNAGLRVATAPFVIFLDADDMLLPDAAATGARLLESHLDAAIACGRCRLVDRQGRRLVTGTGVQLEGDDYAQLLSTNFIWTPGAAVFRRDAVAASGGFPIDFPAAADYRLYLKLVRSYRVIRHSAEVVFYRQHDTNMSSDPVLMLRATLAALADERPHVPATHRAAFRRGWRAWQDYYGDKIANDVRFLVRQRGGVAAAATRSAALLWYHPRGFARHATRKIATALGLRPVVPHPPRKPPLPSDAIPPERAGGERMAPPQPSR
jgi:glycosyltransferase involved in cell wall biosynthesis